MAAFKIISSLFNVILPPGYNFFCRTILDALKGNGVARLHERKPLGNGDRSGVDAVGAVIGQREIVVGVTGNDEFSIASTVPETVSLAAGSLAVGSSISSCPSVSR